MELRQRSARERLKASGGLAPLIQDRVLSGQVVATHRRNTRRATGGVRHFTIGENPTCSTHIDLISFMHDKGPFSTCDNYSLWFDDCDTIHFKILIIVLILARFEEVIKTFVEF